MGGIDVTTFLVIGGIAALIGAYLALDWWLAGRKSKRMMVRAQDGQVGNAGVDYAVIEAQATATQHQTWTGI